MPQIALKKHTIVDKLAFCKGRWWRMDMRRLVGGNFARIRRQKGMTQEDVAEKSGYSQQYLSDLERGLRNPTVITLYELSQALNVSHVELVMPDTSQ